jgi:hypothetical protein
MVKVNTNENVSRIGYWAIYSQQSIEQLLKFVAEAKLVSLLL